MRVVQQLDLQAWNQFIDKHPLANIYHTPEMFQVLTRAGGHCPKLWAVLDHNNEVLALLLPVQITLVAGLLRGFTTRAVSYGSILCAPGPEGYAAIELLLDTYRREVGRHVLFTELRNQSDLSPYQPLLNTNDFLFQDHLNFEIDLEQPEEVLWSKIRKSGRYGIRVAEKKGVRVEERSDAAGVLAAYAKLEPVYARVGVPLADFSLFQAACEILAPRGMLKIFLVYVETKCIGAMVVLPYKDRIIDWYAGGDRDTSATYAPNETLVWHALRWGKQHGYRVFDFGGGGKPNEPYGPREFKVKFGGRQVNYGRNVSIHANWRFTLSQAGYSLYRRLPRARARTAARGINQ